MLMDMQYRMFFLIVLTFLVISTNIYSENILKGMITVEMNEGQVIRTEFKKKQVVHDG